MLREHFQEIELDPGFRIADEGELKLLQADVLEALLEEEYEQASESFIHFMASFSLTCAKAVRTSSSAIAAEVFWIASIYCCT